jgi:hypothetical protein
MYDKQFVDQLRQKAMKNGGLLNSEVRAFISGDRRDLLPTETRHATRTVATPTTELKRAAHTVRQGIEADAALDEMKRIHQRISILS